MKLPLHSASPANARAWLASIVATAAMAGCATYPMPIQQMADAETAARQAADDGATSSADGARHLQLAQDEIARSRRLISHGDYRRADLVLQRAQADAELAIAEGQKQVAVDDAQQAEQALAALRARRPAPGVSVTTTTSGAVPAPPAPTQTTQGGKP